MTYTYGATATTADRYRRQIEDLTEQLEHATLARDDAHEQARRARNRERAAAQRFAEREATAARHLEDRVNRLHAAQQDIKRLRAELRHAQATIEALTSEGIRPAAGDGEGRHRLQVLNAEVAAFEREKRSRSALAAVDRRLATGWAA